MSNKEDLESIVILMATYNGEKYIEEQINSIFKQTHKNWELWIRDDSSSDATVEIIKKFTKQDKRVKFVNSEEKNLGVIGNFSKLLTLSYPCKYFMFCDQDDIWHPDKIELSLDALIRQEEVFGERFPLLVHTDLTVINKEGNTLNKSFFEVQGIQRNHPNPFHELIVENYVTGCTILFNKPLFELATPLPQNVIMHDWWFALVASLTGNIITLNEATINYRQHDQNVAGVTKNNSLAFLLGWNKFKDQIQSSLTQLCVLEEHLHQKSKEKLSSEIKEVYLKFKEGRLFSAIWLLKKGVKSQRTNRTLALYFLILTRKF